MHLDSRNIMLSMVPYRSHRAIMREKRHFLRVTQLYIYAAIKLKYDIGYSWEMTKYDIPSVRLMVCLPLITVSNGKSECEWKQSCEPCVSHSAPFSCSTNWLRRIYKLTGTAVALLLLLSLSFRFAIYLSHTHSM